jgi:hypothetical protein
MKLVNILERVSHLPTDIEDIYDLEWENDEIKYGNDTIIGAGHYANVRKHKGDPHLVVKSQHSYVDEKELKLDSYYQYLNFIRYHKIADKNIHFPRTYKKQLYAKDNKKNYTLEIEKLEHLTDLNIKELSAIFNKDFVDVGDVESIKDYKKVPDIIKYTLNSGNMDKIRSTTLKTSCMILRKIAKKLKKSTYDIHISNIMFRRTPHGPQLVFTDPFSNFSASARKAYDEDKSMERRILIDKNRKGKVK